MLTLQAITKCLSYIDKITQKERNCFQFGETIRNLPTMTDRQSTTFLNTLYFTLRYLKFGSFISVNSNSTQTMFSGINLINSFLNTVYGSHLLENISFSSNLKFLFSITY